MLANTVMMTRPGDSISQRSLLTGRTLAAPDSPAAGYANRLLADLGATTPDTPIDPVAAQIAWARSGWVSANSLANTPCARRAQAGVQAGGLFQHNDFLGFLTMEVQTKRDR